MLQKAKENPEILEALLSTTENEIRRIGKDGPEGLSHIQQLPNSRTSQGLRTISRHPTGRYLLKREYQLFFQHLHTRQRSLLYSQFRSAIKKRNADPYLYYKALGKSRSPIDLNQLQVQGHIYTNPSSKNEVIADSQAAIFTSKHPYPYDLWDRSHSFEGFLESFPHTDIPLQLLTLIHNSLSQINQYKRNLVSQDLQPAKVTPTYAEFLTAIKKASPKSAPGPSGLSYFMLQKLTAETTEAIYSRMLELWNTGEFPLWMHKKLLYPLPKISGSNEISNIRPIVLIEVLRKLWFKVIIFKVNGALERSKILQENQYGFRAGRSCSDALVQLINAME